MNQARTTGGRPLIIVSEDYERLPTINLVIQNVGRDPPRTFRSTSRHPWRVRTATCSDLALFKEGLTSLAPGARIICYWDELENLQPMIEEGRLERNVTVTVEYQDITGGSHSHEWEIDPMLYEGLRTIGYKDMSDLVDTVEEIAEEWRQEGDQGE